MLRCTWCCKDTRTSPCENCGSDIAVVDPYKEHTHDWSRKTITTMECKVCDLEVPNSVYFSGSAPEKGKKERKPDNEIQSGTADVPQGTDTDRNGPKRRAQKNNKTRQ